MSGFVPNVYGALDALRAIGGKLGLRIFQVKIRQRVWAGSRPGLGGAPTDTDTVLVNQAADGTTFNVRVRQVSRREILASGGRYADRDLKVGPLTPPYAAAFQMAVGGFDDTIVNPAPTANATELLWIVSSQNGTYGIPSTGIVCELRGQESTALHTYVILRATGRLP